MKINFYPEYDKPKFEKAAKEYEEIWKDEERQKEFQKYLTE